VLKGEEVVIAKAGKPVARILPVIKDVPTRIPGIDKGKVIIMPDFDDPLPEFDV
jgi:antitoxin (DNA-binding transcriptional repressor) of toxin-antitoxin stability system